MTLRELTVCTHQPYRFPETILFSLSEIGAKSMRNSCESLAAARFPHKPHTLFPNNGFSAQKKREPASLPAPSTEFSIPRLLLPVL